MPAPGGSPHFSSVTNSFAPKSEWISQPYIIARTRRLYVKRVRSSLAYWCAAVSLEWFRLTRFTDRGNRSYNAGRDPKEAAIRLMRQVKETVTLLENLGARLRRARLDRNDSMATFSERLGVSEKTVRALEQGLPTVQVGTWINALWLLDAVEPLERLLEPRESLLERARRADTTPRRRASRRRE